MEGAVTEQCLKVRPARFHLFVTLRALPLAVPGEFDF